MKKNKKAIFELKSKYTPSGDQPQAIEELVNGLEKGEKYQVLLGATGTWKTFKIANVIEKVNISTLVLAQNKVCIFISYYKNIITPFLFQYF